MFNILEILKELTLAGYGVAWNPMYKQFYPFTVEDGETIIWWHDPSNCSSKNFNEAIVATYEEVITK